MEDKRTSCLTAQRTHWISRRLDRMAPLVQERGLSDCCMVAPRKGSTTNGRVSP